jgi:hypothetical protein
VWVQGLTLTHEGKILKTKEFQKVAQQLLPCLPNWFIKGPFVYASPTQHILRGLCFEGSGFDSATFYVTVFFLPLCVPTKIVGLTFGKRLRGEQGTAWNKHDPNLIPELRMAITREALPFLSEVESLPDLARIVAAMYSLKSPYARQAIAYALTSSGQLEAANTQLEQLLEMLDNTVSWQRDMAERAAVLKSQLTNPQAAQQQLRIWEMESRRNLMLD